MNPKVIIQVYMDDGRIFEYEVSSPEKAREHTHAIALSGYRHTVPGLLEHYPPHRISKVKAIGDGVATMYSDRALGT